MAEIAELESVGPVATKKHFAIFVMANVAIGVFLWYVLKGNIHQTVAGTIFMATVIGTLMFWRFRLAIAILGIAFLLVTKTIDVEHMVEFMSTDVIVFLACMMILVHIAKDSGFFVWLLGKILKATRYEPKRAMAVMLAMAALTAAMVDEVTSIVFMTAILFEYCKFFGLNPVPLVISTVLATNIGSSATMLGNPIGILIGLRAGFTFEDFIRWATPVSILALLVIILTCTFWYRRYLGDARARVFSVLGSRGSTEAIGTISPERMREVKLSGALLFGTIILIALHHRIEVAFAFPIHTFFLVAAFTGAGLGLLWKREKARLIVERGVDWWTLVFFMFLFAKAGALKYTGLTDVLAESVARFAVTQLGAQTLMLWFGGIASGFVDNVVIVAVLIPVIHSMGHLGFQPEPLFWALLFGGCYGGNLTMVGSTANIVALGMLEKEFKYVMRFSRWISIGAVGSFLPMLVAQAWLTLFFH